MFEGLTTFFKRVLKQGPTADESSKDTAKEININYRNISI